MVSLSEVVSELQWWTLQKALFPMAHTADRVPPSWIKRTSCGFAGVASGGCSDVASRRIYQYSPSFQAAAHVSSGSAIRSHSIVQPRRQVELEICTTEFRIGTDDDMMQADECFY